METRKWKCVVIWRDGIHPLLGMDKILIGTKEECRSEYETYLSAHESEIWTKVMAGELVVVVRPTSNFPHFRGVKAEARNRKLARWQWPSMTRMMQMKRGEVKRKFWVSNSPVRVEIGSWSIKTPDQKIIDLLLSQCGTEKERERILAGLIETGEWFE